MHKSFLKPLNFCDYESNLKCTDFNAPCNVNICELSFESLNAPTMKMIINGKITHSTHTHTHTKNV